MYFIFSQGPYSWAPSGHSAMQLHPGPFHPLIPGEHLCSHWSLHMLVEETYPLQAPLYTWPSRALSMKSKALKHRTIQDCYRAVLCAILLPGHVMSRKEQYAAKEAENKNKQHCELAMCMINLHPATSRKCCILTYIITYNLLPFTFYHFYPLPLLPFTQASRRHPVELHMYLYWSDITCS